MLNGNKAEVVKLEMFDDEKHGEDTALYMAIVALTGRESEGYNDTCEVKCSLAQLGYEVKKKG